MGSRNKLLTPILASKGNHHHLISRTHSRARQINYNHKQRYIVRSYLVLTHLIWRVYRSSLLHSYNHG